MRTPKLRRIRYDLWLKIQFVNRLDEPAFWYRRRVTASSLIGMSRSASGAFTDAPADFKKFAPAGTFVVDYHLEKVT